MSVGVGAATTTSPFKTNSSYYRFYTPVQLKAVLRSVKAMFTILLLFVLEEEHKYDETAS